MLRVVTIDSDEEDRNVILHVLRTEKNLRVDGVGQDGFDAIRLIRAKKPDILVLDLELSYVSGQGIFPILRNNSPDTAIVVLTDLFDAHHVVTAIRHDVSAFLLKPEDFEKLPSVIARAFSGEYVINKKVMNVFSDLIKTLPFMNEENTGANDTKNKKPSDRTVSAVRLSRTELRIISYIGEGLTNKEIAEQLSLHEGTVRNCISSAIRKAGVINRTQLALYGINSGLVKNSARFI